MGDNKQSMPSIVSKKESEISSCLELPPLPPPTNSSVSNDGSSLVVFPALISLNLENCVLSESNIFKIFNFSSTLRYLLLSGSDIVTIPACIKRFGCLEKLVLNNCKKLREISALPPNNFSVYATGCTSLETFFEESQISQVFNTWCLPKLVRVETVFSAPSPMGSGIEPEVSPSSVNNITPDRKAHVGVDASTATYQNVQALQTPQPWGEHLIRNCFDVLISGKEIPNWLDFCEKEPLVRNCLDVSISGKEIPNWFNYSEEVSISNSDKCEIDIFWVSKCEIDIDVPADVEGEITGIAFAVAFGIVGEDEYIYSHSINFVVIRGGVTIHSGSSISNADLDTVLMHFSVPTFFKHKVDNDRLRVQFRCLKASSRYIKSCGVHLIRRYEEKKIDLINDNQVTKRPRVDDGNLESNWYQHQKRHSSTLGSRFSNAEDMQPGES